MTISIIICTRNRSDLLGNALVSLTAQDFRSEAYEIIVVDNNSTDDTRAVVETFARNSHARVTSVFEGKPGLSHARNSGIEHARSEIIAFMDDDAAAEPGWLAALAGTFDEPATAAVGGPVRPIWESPRPPWLGDKWAPYLSIEEFSAMRDGEEFSPCAAPIGTNMAFRRSFLGADIRFPATLGRRGESLVSNEELYICRQIRARGGRIRFAAGAVMNHLVPATRLTKEWFARRVYWQGRSDVLMAAPPLPEAIRSGLVCLGVIGKYVFLSLATDEAGAFSSRMMVALHRGRLTGLAQRFLRGRGAP